MSPACGQMARNETGTANWKPSSRSVSPFPSRNIRLASAHANAPARYSRPRALACTWPVNHSTVCPRSRAYSPWPTWSPWACGPPPCPHLCYYNTCAHSRLPQATYFTTASSTVLLIDLTWHPGPGYGNCPGSLAGSQRRGKCGGGGKGKSGSPHALALEAASKQAPCAG